MKGVRARIAAALDRRFAALSGQLGRQETAIGELRDALGDVRTSADSAAADLREELRLIRSSLEGELRLVLRSLALEEAGDIRRLQDLRNRDDYGAPWLEPDPLISICIVTRDDRSDLLLERAIPSVLAQTYKNIELVVVGDAISAESQAAIERLTDPRIRFANTTHRLTHADPFRQWLLSSPMARNESHRLSRGLWLSDLDDDDALRPAAVESLLEFAVAGRHEVAYGQLELIAPDGAVENIGSFPPRPTELSSDSRFQPWEGRASTGALYHHGLRIFARHHVAQELGIPGDFFILERMVKAGVRFGMLDKVIYDYYASKLGPRP